jgi:hypothetical protein
VVDLAALRASPARARVLLAAAETALRGREPMEEEQARRLAGLARPGLDVAALAADRAEALVQLAAAEATLAGLEAPAVAPQATSDAGLEAPAVAPQETSDAGLEAPAVAPQATSDADLLRRVAGEALEAQALLESAREEEEPAEPAGPLPAARRELSVARQRMAGAVISATGMVIVVAAAGWSPLWHAAPVLLVVLFAADLRMAMREARETPADEAPTDETLQAAEDAAARALGRWATLVPEGPPADVERIIAQRGLPQPAGPAPAAIALDAGADRTLALRLAEEARADLARAERGLTDLAQWLGLGPLDPAEIPTAAGRVLAEAEYARRSLAWYEARRAVEATEALASR